MTNKFFHVGFGFAGVARVRDLEPVFTSLQGDWIRYSNSCWVVWTHLEAIQIMYFLQAHINSDDQVLITPFDIRESWGSLPPWMWTWMNSKIPGNNVVFGDHLRLAGPPRALPKSPIG
jgi:hypothetical protein